MREREEESKKEGKRGIKKKRERKRKSEGTKKREKGKKEKEGKKERKRRRKGGGAEPGNARHLVENGADVASPSQGVMAGPP